MKVETNSRITQTLKKPSYAAGVDYVREEILPASASLPKADQ